MKKIYPIWYTGLTLSLCVFFSVLLFSYEDFESLLLHEESIALIIIIVSMSILAPGFHYGLDADAFYVCWYFHRNRIPYNELDSVINWRFGGYWFCTIDGRTFVVLLLLEKKKLYTILDHILAKNSRCDISEITGYHLKYRPTWVENEK